MVSCSKFNSYLSNVYNKASAGKSIYKHRRNDIIEFVLYKINSDAEH